MATKGERQALVFLAAVALLGAGTRVYRARHVAVDTAAIDEQLAAVEESRTTARRRPSGRRGPGAGPQTAPVVAAEIPPPLAPPQRIDLDRAAAAEIERLPGIGPALARRILDDRAVHGPFGCLAALDAVKGIGPAALRRLDSLVAFSGLPRAACSGPPPGG